MTDFTPGSRWLLPVTFDGNAYRARGLTWVLSKGALNIMHRVDDGSTLIPASRLADLEAEVARWQQLYEDARHDLTKAEMEVERLRAGLTAIWDDTYPRPHQLNGQCKHGQYIHEQCEECIWDYAHIILNPKD
jgi:uncharacterized membrane protein YccC